MPPALEVWNLNHWTAREVSDFFFKEKHIWGNSLAVQWLGLRASTAGAWVQSLDQETKILHAVLRGHVHTHTHTQNQRFKKNIFLIKII